MIPSDERIARILLQTRTIAVVGVSMKPERASHQVAQYLSQVGYRVIPVNPGHAGKELFGETVVARLSDIKDDVQLVDIFRKSQDVLPIVEEAVDHLGGLQTIWMQLDIESAEVRALGDARGLAVIENRCTASEHRRLLGGRPAG